jgi:hypothetical protein
LPRQITLPTVAADAATLQVDGNGIFYSAKNPHQSSSQARQAPIGYPKFKV